MANLSILQSLHIRVARQRSCSSFGQSEKICSKLVSIACLFKLPRIFCCGSDCECLVGLFAEMNKRCRRLSLGTAIGWDGRDRERSALLGSHRRGYTRILCCCFDRRRKNSRVQKSTRCLGGSGGSTWQLPSFDRRCSAHQFKTMLQTYNRVS